MKDPVTVALDAAIESLKAHPSQSFIVVSGGVVGIAPAGGGVGVQGVAIGGAPGSHATGVYGSAGDAQGASIAPAAADDAIRKEAERAMRELEALKALVLSPKPDKDSVMGRLGALAKTYMPPVAISVLEALIKAKLGL